MNNVEDWAMAIRAIDRIHGHRHMALIPDPRLVVQSVTKNVVLCDAPIECFSAKMPTLPPASPAADLLPIDILYGSYDPNTRGIEIYIKNIRRDASIFGGDCPDLLDVVRLHEYAHAVVHLGVRLSQVPDTLNAMAPDGYTDWKTFLDRRRRIFEHLDSASHEFLAQAITFTSIIGLGDGYRSERLRATFEALEARQPDHYIVPTEIKACAQQADWSLVLEAARGDIDAFRASGFSMYAGLLALAHDFAG